MELFITDFLFRGGYCIFKISFIQRATAEIGVKNIIVIRKMTEK